MPVLFTEELKPVEAVEGGTATLQCQLGTEAPVEWRKGLTLLRASNKYKMRQEGTMAELLIHDLEPKDAGDYSCLVGSQKSTAALSVNGKKAEITCETLECFCPPLPSSSLHIPSRQLPSCPASTAFFHPLARVTPVPSLHFTIIHVGCVRVVLSSHLPSSEGVVLHVCFPELARNPKVPWGFLCQRAHHVQR